MPSRHALVSGSVLLAALLAVAPGCESAPPNPWPAELIDNFLRGCRGKTADAQCECAVDRLQRRFSAEEFQAIERELTKGVVSKAMADAVADCAGR